jgi:hypothetical protein
LSVRQLSAVLRLSEYCGYTEIARFLEETRDRRGIIRTEPADHPIHSAATRGDEAEVQRSLRMHRAPRHGLCSPAGRKEQIRFGTSAPAGTLRGHTACMVDSALALAWLICRSADEARRNYKTEV